MSDTKSSPKKSSETVFNLVSTTWSTASEPLKKASLHKPKESEELRQQLENERQKGRMEILKLVQPHQWPFSWRRGNQEWIEIVNREVGSGLAQVLAQMPNSQFPTAIFSLDMDLADDDDGQPEFRVKVVNGHNTASSSMPFQQPLEVPFEDVEDEILFDIYQADEKYGRVQVPLKMLSESVSYPAHIIGKPGTVNLKKIKTVDRPNDKKKVQEEFQKYLLNLHGADLQSMPEEFDPANVKWGLWLTPTKSIKAEKLKATFVGLPHETILDGTVPTWVPLPLPYPLMGHILKIASCSNERSKKSSGTEKVKDKLKLLKTKIQMTTNENDQNEGKINEKEEEITVGIHQIPFLEGKFVRLGSIEVHVSIKIQPDLGLEKAKYLLSLDSCSLFCPFFSDWQWKVSKTNLLLTYMAMGEFPTQTELEVQLFKHMLEIKEMELKYLDQELLSDFYHHLLGQLVSFSLDSTDMNRYSTMISIINILPWHQNLKRDLTAQFSQRFEKKLDTENIQDLSDKIDQELNAMTVVSQKLTGFFTPTILDIWSRTLIESSLREIPFHQNKANQECDIDMAFFRIFKRLQVVSDFTDSFNPISLSKFFQPCLQGWAEAIATKASKHVEKLLELKEKEHHGHYADVKNLKLKNEDNSSFIINDETLENWKNAAGDFNGICHTVFLEWQKLEWPDLGQSLDFGTQLIQNLRSLFKTYVDSMYKIILLDDHFSHEELTSALQSLHLAAEFESEILLFHRNMHLKVHSEGEEKEVEQLSVKEYVEEEACLLITRFSKLQVPHLQRLIKKGRLYNADEDGKIKPLDSVAIDSDEEKDTLLGYLNILLKYFETMLSIPDKPDTQNIYINKIKNLLFDSMEEELLKHNKNNFSKMKEVLNCFTDNGYLIQFEQALQLAQDFRQELQLGESPGLKMAQKERDLEKASDDELIASFLGSMDFSECERRGDFNLSVTNQGHHQWKVELKSIAKLKPRMGRELNFSLVMKLLPQMDNAQRFETRVYNDALDMIFDMVDEGDEEFQFYFEGVAKSPDNFLQFVIYDHSKTQTNKIFRAMHIMSLDKDFDGQVQLFSCPLPSSSDPTWRALCSRAKKKPAGKISRFVKGVKDYAYERRRSFQLPARKLSCISNQE